MLSALVVAALIAGAQVPPAPPDPEEIVRSLGTASYTIGVCEPFMTPGAARSILDSLAFPEEKDAEVRAMLANLSARMYQEGQASPIRKKMTALECAEALARAAEGMGAALASDRANRGAQP